MFGPRRCHTVDTAIDNCVKKGMAILTQERDDRDRERERERLHVRGEAHPLLHLKQQTNGEEDDDDDDDDNDDVDDDEDTVLFQPACVRIVYLSD